jgi:hypothetical protein
MDLLPTGIARVGTSSTACVVPLVAGVRQAPQRGSPGFGLTFSAAPPLSSGAVLVGSGLTQPWPVLGADILVSPWVSVGAASDGLGFATFGLPVPATVQVGAQLSVQAVFLTNAACPGSGLIASSDRIDVTVF